MLFQIAKDFLPLLPSYRRCIGYRKLPCEGKIHWKESQAAPESMVARTNPYRKRGTPLYF